MRTHIPIHCRATLSQPLNQVGLAVDPPEPLLPRQSALRPVTTEDFSMAALMRAVIAFSRACQPLVQFLQKVSAVWRAEREKLIR